MDTRSDRANVVDSGDRPRRLVETVLMAIADVKGLSRSSVNLRESIVLDYDFNSIDLVELMVRLEAEAGRPISISAIQKWHFEKSTQSQKAAGHADSPIMESASSCEEFIAELNGERLVRFLAWCNGSTRTGRPQDDPPLA
jgi:acyl carrier protein